MIPPFEENDLSCGVYTPMSHRQDIANRVAALNVQRQLLNKQLVYNFTQFTHLPVRPCNMSNRLIDFGILLDHRSEKRRSGSVSSTRRAIIVPTLE